MEPIFDLGEIWVQTRIYRCGISNIQFRNQILAYSELRIWIHGNYIHKFKLYKFQGPK